jgi:hypothetical protein
MRASRDKIKSTTDLPDNIKEFATIAGLVFVQLYKAFPEPININLEAIAVAMGIDAEHWREHGLPSGRRFTVAQSLTIGWLKAEGFTRSFGSHPSEQVLLATKGLVAMNALPPEPHGQSVGTKLTEASQNASHIDTSRLGEFIAA